MNTNEWWFIHLEDMKKKKYSKNAKVKYKSTQQ